MIWGKRKKTFHSRSTTAQVVSVQEPKWHVYVDVTKPASCCCNYDGTKEEVVRGCSWAKKSAKGGGGGVGKKSDFNTGGCCSFPISNQQSLLLFFKSWPPSFHYPNHAFIIGTTMTNLKHDLSLRRTKLFLWLNLTKPQPHCCHIIK